MSLKIGVKQNISFVMPNQWRACTGHSQLSHSGKISILLGGDNFHAFPKEQDCNSKGTELFKREITTKYLIFVVPTSQNFQMERNCKKHNCQQFQNPHSL